MTDVQESGNPTGAAGANQQVSGAGSDQQSSAQSAVLDLQSLAKSVDELTRQVRSMQSGKDRGISQQKAEIQEVKQQFANLFERLEAGGYQVPSPSAQAPVGNQKPGAVFDPQAIVTALGLDPASAETAQLLNDTDGDPVAFTMKAAQAALSKRQVTPNPAAVQQVSAPAASVPNDADQLVVRLQKLSEQPGKNAKEIEKVRAQLEKALRQQ
jgi:hypothetical protein